MSEQCLSSVWAVSIDTGVGVSRRCLMALVTVETRGSCLSVSECLVSDECQRYVRSVWVAADGRDVEGVVVPNGQGQGLEPPSKPIGCIPISQHDSGHSWALLVW